MSTFDEDVKDAEKAIALLVAFGARRPEQRIWLEERLFGIRYQIKPRVSVWDITLMHKHSDRTIIIGNIMAQDVDSAIRQAQNCMAQPDDWVAGKDY